MPNIATNKGLWFDPNSLEKLAEGGAWSRGLMLYRNQKVRTLEIDPDGDGWRLLGEVQGSLREPYAVSIDMALDRDGRVDFWESDCECPVGMNCKHGVALMLKAAYQGLQLMDGEALVRVKAPSQVADPAQTEIRRQANLTAMAEIARLEAEAALLRWLQDIDQASGKTVATPGFENRERFGYKARPPERAEQYLYLLTLSNNAGHLPKLQLSAVVSYPKANGGWAKTKALKSQPYAGQAVYDLASATDRELLQLMRALPGLSGSHGPYNYNAKVLPNGQLGAMALQLASQTGRLFLDDGDASPGQPVTWGPAQALSWDWIETQRPKSASVGWVLRAQLAVSGVQLCLNTPPLYLDAERGRCGPVTAEGIAPAALNALLKAPPIPEAALQKHQLALIQRLGPLPLPPSVQGITPLQGITPRTLLQLTPTAPQDVARQGLIQARLSFEYAGHRGWWADASDTVLLDTAGGRFLLQRDRAAEQLAVTRLAELGLLGNPAGEFSIPGDWDQQSWLHWADTDYAELRAAGFEVTVDEALDGWISHADTLDVQMQTQGEDEATSPWFNLSLGMEINGKRHNILPWLPELIAAAAASPIDPATGQPEIPPFIFLPDLTSTSGGFIRLPTETLRPWMAALLELVGDRNHDFSGDSLKLSRLDALRASAALGEGAVWKGAASLRALVSQLSGKSELPEVPVPEGVKAELRPYQRQGLAWLQFLREHGLAGILADDMGLGKTLQTLALLIARSAGGPALVIAPTSVCGNWLAEAARFAPGLQVAMYGDITTSADLEDESSERNAAASDTLIDSAGNSQPGDATADPAAAGNARLAARRKQVAALGPGQVLVCSYGLLQIDGDILTSRAWHSAVLDEAQAIKNAGTRRAKAASALQADFKLALTGTPIENRLSELWSIMGFANPGLLGSAEQFNQRFALPIERDADPQAGRRLRRLVAPFLLRRTKAEVLADLPARTEIVHEVVPGSRERALLEALRQQAEESVNQVLAAGGAAGPGAGEGQAQMHVLAALTKLRRAACDPRLVAPELGLVGAKVQEFERLAQELVAGRHKALVFSQFTDFLALLRERLDSAGLRYQYLDGSTPAAQRTQRVAAFQAGEGDFFLISLKAGGFGLNLTMADYVIITDPWWNPAAEDQASARAHRIGQQRPVTVYRLVTQGSIEDRIVKLHHSKRALAEGVLAGQDGGGAVLRAADMLALLRGEDAGGSGDAGEAAAIDAPA